MNVGPQISPMMFRGSSEEVVEESLNKLRKQRQLIEALATAAANYFAADIDQQIEQLTQTKHQIVSPYGWQPPTIEDLAAASEQRSMLEEALVRLDASMDNIYREASDSPLRMEMETQYAMARPLMASQLSAAKQFERSIQQQLEQAQGASTQTPMAPEGEKP